MKFKTVFATILLCYFSSVGFSQNNDWKFTVVKTTMDNNGEIIHIQEKWLTLAYLKTQLPIQLINYILWKIPAILTQLAVPAPPLDPAPLINKEPSRASELTQRFIDDRQQYQKNMEKYDRHTRKLRELYAWAVFAKPRHFAQYTVRYMDTARMYTITHEEQDNHQYEYAFIDSAADTFGVGGKAWVIDTLTNRKVQVAGYHSVDTVMNDIPIGSAITAVD